MLPSVETGQIAGGPFEGPLGLLLELIESGQIEVSTVSVGDITARYLAKIAQMDVGTPEELADFVELGGRLLYIKSLSLLPKMPDVAPPKELSNLNRELAEYHRMQLAATELATYSANRSWPRTLTERLDPSDLPFPDVSSSRLAQAFGRALAKTPPTLPTTVIKQHTSQAQVTSRIKQELSRGRFNLQVLIDVCQDRIEIIITFLALLELWRTGVAQIVQQSQFAPIIVEPAGA